MWPSQLERVGIRKVRPSIARNYSRFVACITVASFFTILLIQLLSTLYGLMGDGYGVVVMTNSLGENYVELFAELASIPGVLSLFKHLAERK